MKKLIIILLLPSFMTSCQFIKNFFKQKEQQVTQQLKERKKRNAKMDYRTAQKDFLDKNKDKDGVETTSSGLQYKILKKEMVKALRQLLQLKFTTKELLLMEQNLIAPIKEIKQRHSL